MTKLCPRGKAAAKRKFTVYPSAYANAYASKICAGKIKDPSGVKRKDFKGPKPTGAKDGKMISRDQRQREIRKKQNPISEYDRKGKLKYTAAKKGSMMIIIGIGKKKKADKKMGGGLAAATEKLKARGLNKGGGADTGTMGERKSKLGVALQRVKRTMKKDKDRLTQKDIEFAKQTLKFKKMNKGGGADYMNTVKPRKRGNPAVVSNTDERAVKKGIIRRKNKFSGGGMARGGGAAIRGNKFQGIF